LKKILSVFGGAALAAAGLGIYMSQRLLHMRKKDFELIYQREVDAMRLDPLAYESLPKSEIWIPSPHGYSIKAVIARPHPSSNKYMVFCHGVTENKLNSVKYMNIFIKKGFNAIIYDHRHHGETGGTMISYGYYEKDDLKAVVDYLVETEGRPLFIGVHGESMGAATCLLYGGSPGSRADFYVADCPFSDFSEQLAYRFTKEMRLPGKYFVPLANLFVRLRGGFSLKAVSPIEVIENITKPVLFIHSEKDDYILPSMSKDLYERKKGAKMLFIAKNGAHAESLNENPEEYEHIIDQFLTSIVFKEPPHDHSS
jgi:alpha-beta hydrolase superfamily lysophospholipase